MALPVEEARRQLEAAAVPDAREAAQRRALRMAGTAGRVAQALTFADPRRGTERRPLSRLRIGRWLDEASPRQRRRIWRLLNPQLVDLLEAWWTVDGVREPYPEGYARRSFRAPRHPELSRDARVGRLQAISLATHRHHRPIAWYAAWASHLEVYGTSVGRLLAAALDRDDEEVRGILHATLRNDHPIGRVGRDVVAALLASSDPRDWAEVERLLLAAQRQEGLRSVVLETVDLAHPGAFRRVLGTVRDHDLTRFAAVVRAVGVWFGVDVDVRDRPVVDALIADAVVLLDDAAAREAAVTGPDPSRVHLALWCVAFEDAPAAVDRAGPLLGDPDPDRRLAAAAIMDAAQLSHATRRLLPSLADDDLRVAAVAARAVQADLGLDASELAAPARALLARVPKRTEVDVGLLKPEPVTLDPALVADALAHRTRPADVLDLDDVLGRMSATGRGNYARKLADDPRTHRQRLLDLLGDRSGFVRDTVLETLVSAPPPTPAEAPALEALLTRKAAALRRGVLGLLLRQPDAAVIASIDRLRTGSPAQRTAAVELLRELVGADRGGDVAADRVRALDADASLPDEGRRLLASSVEDPAIVAATPTALIDHTARTPATRPARRQLDLAGLRPGTERVLTSLDAWLSEHRDVEVAVRGWDGADRQVILGDLRHLTAPRGDLPWADQLRDLPLASLLDPWWERTRHQLPAGGVELAVALAGAEGWLNLRDPFRRGSYTGRDQDPPTWIRRVGDRLVPSVVADRVWFLPVITTLLRWYVAREADADWVDPLLDVAETCAAEVPSGATHQLPTVRDHLTTSWQDPPLAFDWRDGPVSCATATLVGLEAMRPELFTPRSRGRLWRLVRFLDEPGGPWTPEAGYDELDDAHRRSTGTPSVPRRPTRRSADVQLCVRAVEDGAADRSDLIELLVGERVHVDGQAPSIVAGPHHAAPLSELTRRRPSPTIAAHPWVGDVVDEVRRRIVATEAGRGELPTPVSGAARKLRSVRGADATVALLTALGHAKLVRGWTWGTAVGRPEVLSHLLQVSFPAADDTPERFATLARAARIRDRRLLELAVYAPQWATAVEHTLARPGLADAVHWLHAHTKDDRWSVDADVRAEWAATTSERTPLTADELVDGAVDVAWFERVTGELGDDGFDELLKVGKLAATGGGHKRAELFAEALRGRVDRADLDRRIAEKRHQDAVRALGLLPLPDEPDDARAEVLARYEQLEDWRRGSSRFGQQRRASEALAVDVAHANLARTAGYADPQRLRWAMEAEAIRDLAAGPIVVTEDDVVVTLSLDEEGQPELAVTRGARSLRTIPRAVAKRPAIVDLKARVKRLRDQARRMRTSLERAMVRGDRFEPDELVELLAHPTLAPMLRALVLLDGDGRAGTVAETVTRWSDAGGAVFAPAAGPVAIAHPVDLLATDAWHRWQRRLFDDRIRQPFKQVFRELYVPTSEERGGAVRSSRYAGHQVQPGRAIALLGSRGWVADRDLGAIRTDHAAAVTVRVEVLNGWLTAAEAAEPTLETVTFTRSGSWEPLPLADVAPRLFSEAMRDLDLVVSVAHSGGVDPEASASTVEVRAALVRETAELLGFDNVELTDHHALVSGELASYSVHLGSGTVHRRPGNAVCIVPVGAQHRGRLFLPFVDDDPRTAEVISKVVLLARDGQIQDPTILEQLRA